LAAGTGGAAEPAHATIALPDRTAKADGRGDKPNIRVILADDLG
jgi:hypothetical protein